MRPRLDRPPRPFRPRCLILGMVFAWIAALYVPSLLLAASGRAAGNILAGMWALADDIAFPAKAGTALVLTALLMGSRRIVLNPRPRMAADAVLGALAMLLVLLLIPEDWSRGFGIGLTGQRLDPAILPFYLFGGALAGLVFSLADAKCGELRKPT